MDKRYNKQIIDLGKKIFAEKEKFEFSGEELRKRQYLSGLSIEDLELILHPMAEEGKEASGSMGDDTPIAALSSKPKSVFSYFKQRFAQVTNPPIDPYREDSVMSLRVVMGDKSNFFDKIGNDNDYIFFDSPVLTNKEFSWINNLDSSSFKVSKLNTLFEINKNRVIFFIYKYTINYLRMCV